MKQDWDKYRDKIIGFGEHSMHKSYYPELQEQIDNLEASQENLKTLINSMSDAIIIHDIEGNILSINEQAKRIYNIEEIDETVYTIYDISSPNQDTSNLQEIWDATINNTPHIFEWLGLQLKTNIEMEVQVSISQTLWNGKPAIVAVVRDFSERKKFEQELIRAKEKAEEANKLKTEFLNNMSHEIRTPMNGIVGFSKMIENNQLTDDERKYFSRIIKNSSYQLLKIIDDILEISILETKQIKVFEEVFYVNNIVMELFSIFSLKAKERNIPIYLKKGLEDDQCQILTDKTKLLKILNNLLENALKFTNSGYIELGYYLENSTIVFYVKDSGIGISKEKQEKIFERFSQEEQDISRNYGGLGLGLSISKENAQLLGGDIFIESEKGKGSVFFVKIPYNQGKDSSQVSIKEIPNDNLAQEKPQFNILVAEDEQINYLYIEALLKRQGFKLYHARNGKEALDICNSNDNIDLVLMDIKMPIMDGYEATERIKSKFPNLPVIAQTAYSTEPQKKEAFSKGCDEFISKPIEKKLLLSLINKYLKTTEI